MTLAKQKRLGAGVLGIVFSLTCGATNRTEGVIPCRQEREQARRTAERIEQEWPLRGSDAVVQFVRELGWRLGGGKDGVSRWRVNVVRDHSVNAFAIGDGRIYITDGAIRSTDSIDELAAILAHEMGHQRAGHFCPRSARADKGISWNPLDWFFKDQRNGVRRRQIGSFTQVIDPEKEREADEIATRILRNAGYDSRAMLRLAQRLLTGQLSSHLTDRRRVDSLRKLLARHPPKLPPVSRHFEKEYEAIKRLMEKGQV